MFEKRAKNQILHLSIRKVFHHQQRQFPRDSHSHSRNPHIHQHRKQNSRKKSPLLPVDRGRAHLVPGAAGKEAPPAGGAGVGGGAGLLAAPGRGLLVRGRRRGVDALVGLVAGGETGALGVALHALVAGALAVHGGGGGALAAPGGVRHLV